MIISDDTICALSTPVGISGLAVVRLSGKDALDIADNIFSGSKSLKSAKTHTIHFGNAVNSEGIIDQVTASIFLSPNSYTGEDTVEFGLHGGYFSSKSLIESLIVNGARLAEAGEFTKRAFLNGKMDLTQAEAVADIIHANSSISSKIAARQLNGGLKKNLNELRNSLVECASLLELEFDFAEDDYELLDRDLLKSKIVSTIEFCKRLESNYYSTQIFRTGYKIGIIGYPNAGKSSLFNALVGKNRAIVSEVPGTTRDYLEESLLIDGILVKFYDTAGVRDSSDFIEMEGIRLAKNIIDESDAIFFINDITKGFDYSNSLINAIKSQYPNKIYLLLHNKADIKYNNSSISSYGNVLHISAKIHTNIDLIFNFIKDNIISNFDTNQEYSLNFRQQTELKHTLIALESSLNSINNCLDAELIAFELRDALKFIGNITGENFNTEVLNNIFSKFCIGK